MHLACLQGHKAVVSLLLKHGADLQAVTKVGCWQCFQTTVCDTCVGAVYACVVVNKDQMCAMVNAHVHFVQLVLERSGNVGS